MGHSSRVCLKEHDLDTPEKLGSKPESRIKLLARHHKDKESPGFFFFFKLIVEKLLGGQLKIA